MSTEYYHTPESVAEYIQMAKDVNGQELIDRLKTHLPEGSTVLELGSGPGTDWEILAKDYTVTGSDLSEEFLKHLRTAFPQGNFLHLDASTPEIDHTFGAIYSNKVLHHLTNEALLHSAERQAAILEPGGIISHSFWKGTGDEVFKGMYVNYHDETSLERIFTPHFNILSLTDYAEFETGDSIQLLAKKRG